MANIGTSDDVKLPEAGSSVAPLFVIGDPPQKLIFKGPRLPTQSRVPAHLSSSPTSRPDNDSSNKRVKPKVYGTTRLNRKSGNTPVAQAVPLAFPASTNFIFKASNIDVKSLLSASDREPPIRAIQILPTEVLMLVIQSIEPKRHHPILKNLVLVNQALNASIAPLLYHRLRLFNLREVYDFSLHFRHPICVTSLDMFITPDPNDLGWLPHDSAWTKRLVEMLRKTERLMSLRINRCDVGSALSAITNRADDPGFLPALQKLSFGHWHELSRLGSGRSITSYGLTFNLHAPHDHEKLERTLVALKQHGNIIQELKLTASIAHKPDLATPETSDYRKSLLQLIIKHFPKLHTLVLRTQCQAPRAHALSHKATDILTLIHQRMENLSILEIYDPRSPQYRSDAIIKVAIELSKEQGLCPNLQSISLDGLLWKRARSQFDSTSSISLHLSSLILGEKDESRGSSEKDKSHIFVPKVTWTPCPSNPRGRAWWARRATELHATSKAQAVFLLRQWMLQYWGPEHVMNDDNQLERSVTRW